MPEDTPLPTLTRPAIRARLKSLGAARRAELRATLGRARGAAAHT